MRSISAIVVLALLFLGCAQLGGEKGGSAGASTQTAARPKLPDSLCSSVGKSVNELDRYLNKLNEINICLIGVPTCEAKNDAKRACEARDSLANFHDKGECTEQMLGPRPGLCSRL
jgi:hypothetical protein